jgi:Zn-finger domain-containing protein
MATLEESIAAIKSDRSVSFKSVRYSNLTSFLIAVSRLSLSEQTSDKFEILPPRAKAGGVVRKVSPEEAETLRKAQAFLWCNSVVAVEKPEVIEMVKRLVNVVCVHADVSDVPPLFF